VIIIPQLQGIDRWNFIQELMKAGLPQEKIARKLGITHGTLRKWISQNKDKYAVVLNTPTMNYGGKTQAEIDQEMDELDYWCEMVCMVNNTLQYDFPQAPKNNTYFFEDEGLWLFFLNFDYDMFHFSFWEARIMECDGLLPTDPFYDLREVFPDTGKIPEVLLISRSTNQPFEHSSIDEWT
jgi:hypothetical protein